MESLTISNRKKIILQSIAFSAVQMLSQLTLQAINRISQYKFNLHIPVYIEYPTQLLSSKTPLSNLLSSNHRTLPPNLKPFIPHCRPTRRIRLVLLTAHLPRVPAMLLQIRPELQILAGDGILPDMRQEKQGQKRAQEAQAAADEKGILTASDAVGAAGRVGLDDGEDVGPDEGTDFAGRGGDGVVLPADGGGAGLGGDEADVVAGSGFAEGEEDAVDDDETADVGGGVQQGVAAGHDEAHDTLQSNEDAQGVSGANPVADEGAADGTGEIEQIYYGIPSKTLPERGAFTQDDLQPGGGVDAERIGGEIVDEPDQGHNCEAEPVEPNPCLVFGISSNHVAVSHLMTSHHGVCVFFMDSRLNSSGS